MTWREFRKTENWAPAVGVCVLRLLARTLRWTITDVTRARMDAMFAGEPFIVIAWHNQILLMPWLWQRFYLKRRKRLVVLTSVSKDGELLTNFAKQFGIGAVRGSARRRGSRAILDLMERLKDGEDVCITPDGSNGPVYELKPGVVLLGEHSGARVVPAHIIFSKCWQLRSWDGFRIPHPFSRVEFRLGEPITVKPGETPEDDFETNRLRLQRALMDGVESAVESKR